MKKLVSLRTFILVFLTHKIALPLLKLIRNPNDFKYDVGELKQFSPGSLGNDLYLFLKNRNLPLLKHYVRRDLNMYCWDTIQRTKEKFVFNFL